ncbi:hypothetical protein TNIN_359801 [Trichonephila inaurata madagascariensis]|uniref:Uncharacterized protein n=1 Tax=Trichonephila inaurata madagascariensis TaxID=2747483 RepID=A0A8X7CFP9_9ARAC|nr:hypothetical protein TNIN_359801 [Trichonephila inaurata madagascariensis]
MNFRTILNSLKPSEVIQLETVYAMDIIDLLMQVLPDHEPHDVPWFECSISETAGPCIVITWSERPPKEKAPIRFSFCGLNMPNLNYGFVWRSTKGQTLEITLILWCSFEPA